MTRVRVGVLDFPIASGARSPAQLPESLQEMNFDMVAVSDIWRLRREAAQGQLKEKLGHDVKTFRNNDECIPRKSGCGDHQYGRFSACTARYEAVKAGCDA